MGYCIFCGDKTEYMRDRDPYKLTPFCLSCVAPYGVTSRSDTGHLLVPEILDQFYCTQPDPLPHRLLPGVQTHVRDWRVWISTGVLNLNSNGLYLGTWKTDEAPYTGSAPKRPEDLNWVTVKRPPRVGEVWNVFDSLSMSLSLPEVTILRIRKDSSFPYVFARPEGGEDALQLDAFMRRLKPSFAVPGGDVPKHESSLIIRWPHEDEQAVAQVPPPPAPQPSTRAQDHRRQLMAQLSQDLPTNFPRGRHKY